MPDKEKKTWWIGDVSFKEGAWVVTVVHSYGYSNNKRGRSLTRIIEEVALNVLELQAKGVEFDNERSCMRTLAEGT